MTAVQQVAIPVILSGQDVLIKSQTGSGQFDVFGFYEVVRSYKNLARPDKWCC